MGGHWALAVVCFPALAIQPPPHAPEAAQVRRPLRRATSRPAPIPLPTRAAVASAASTAAASSDAASSDTASLPPLARSDAPASSLHRSLQAVSQVATLAPTFSYSPYFSLCAGYRAHFPEVDPAQFFTLRTFLLTMQFAPCHLGVHFGEGGGREGGCWKEGE